MAKIIVRHEMFNIRKGLFKMSVQSDNFHCMLIWFSILVIGFNFLCPTDAKNIKH
jgi:hypothetical protein